MQLRPLLDAADGPARSARSAAGVALPLAAVLLSSAALCPATSRAADCQPSNGLSTCIDADNLWPAPGGSSWQTLYPTELTPAGLVHFGLVLSYLSRPIGLVVSSPDPDGTTIHAIDDRVSATFLTAVGVGQGAALTLAAPMVLYQNGASIYDVTGEQEFLPRSAFGDLRFGAAVTLLDRAPDMDGVAMAGRFELATPTGDREAFASHGVASYAPGLSFDHRVGRFSWGLDGSARIRPVRELAGARIGTQLGLAAGANVDILANGWLSAALEAYALFGLAEQRELVWDPVALERVAEPSGTPHIPTEWLASVRSAGLLDEQLALSLSGGGFIPTADDSAVTTPRFRFVFGVRYVPVPDAYDAPDEE
jgi:hypothetical protein